MAYCLEAVTEAELWNLEGSWRELFRQCSYATPFAAWEWATEWWRHFATCSAMNTPRLLTLTVYDTDKTLLGIAPLYHSYGRNLLAAWSDRELPFAQLPDSRLQRRQAIPLQTLPLPATWEALRRGVRKSMRDNLAYYPRLLRRRGHSFAVHTLRAPADVARAVGLLTDLHRRRAACSRGVPHTNHLSGEVQQRFLSRCLPLLAAQGMAAILLLEIDGELAAAQSVLESAGTLILYYSGFDPCWYDYSPVALLCAEAIRDAIQRGLKMINFLPVEAEYKSRWGAKPGRELHELVYPQPRPLSMMRALLHTHSLNVHL